MAPGNFILRLLVVFLIHMQWVARVVRTRLRKERRERLAHIESSFYWDDSVGKVPNTDTLMRELESGAQVLSVDALCEDYYDPSTGFLVLDYSHGGRRYRVHVRKRVHADGLLFSEASAQPVLSPPIFASFSRVVLETEGRDLTELFTASAGPFGDFGGGALARGEPSAEACIPVEDILIGADIGFQSGAHLLVGGPEGHERVPVAAVIRFTRSEPDPKNPKVLET